MCRDDHQFSPLHWAAKGGQLKIVEMLVGRGARVHTTNMGDDTPLHLAAAHGHREVAQLLLRQKVIILQLFIFIIAATFAELDFRVQADVNFVNEHGNSALHYACFWGYAGLAEDLVQAGALVGVQNKYQETPLDKAGGQLAARLQDSAARTGQDLKVGWVSKH